MHFVGLKIDSGLIISMGVHYKTNLKRSYSRCIFSPLNRVDSGHLTESDDGSKWAREATLTGQKLYHHLEYKFENRPFFKFFMIIIA